jgi:hypothetical protein
VEEEVKEARRRLGGREKFELLEEVMGVRVKVKISRVDGGCGLG